MGTRWVVQQCWQQPARLPKSKAVVTIGAPADVAHVLAHLGGSLAQIKADGEGEVTLAGRSFKIRRSFVEDAKSQRIEEHVRTLSKALLVMHAPRDNVVGIDNASRIFLAARHPKSFVSLDDADHLLSSSEAATYAASVIVAWASKYVPEPSSEAGATDHVLVAKQARGSSRISSWLDGIACWPTNRLRSAASTPDQALTTICRLRSGPARQ